MKTKQAVHFLTVFLLFCSPFLFDMMFNFNRFKYGFIKFN
nr:MAG TPA: hypothetical protein [Caudoviricetes sp.]